MESLMKKLLLGLALGLTNLTLQSAFPDPLYLPEDIEDAVTAAVTAAETAAETEIDLFNSVPDFIAEAVEREYTERGQRQVACKYCSKMIAVIELNRHVRQCGKKQDQQKNQPPKETASAKIQNNPQHFPPLLPTPALPPLLPRPVLPSLLPRPVLPPLLPTQKSTATAPTVLAAAQGAQQKDGQDLDFFEQLADEGRLAKQQAAQRRHAADQAEDRKTKKRKF